LLKLFYGKVSLVVVRLAVARIQKGAPSIQTSPDLDPLIRDGPATQGIKVYRKVG